MYDVKRNWVDFYQKFFNISLDCDRIIFEESDYSLVIDRKLNLLAVARAFRKFDYYQISPHLEEQIADSVLRPSGRTYKTKVNTRISEKLLTHNNLLEVLVFSLKYFFNKGVLPPYEEIVCLDCRGFGFSTPVIVIKNNDINVLFADKV